MTDLTPEAIADLDAKAAAATPGPWRTGGPSAPIEIWANIGTSWNAHLVASTATRLNPDPISPGDPEFIAAASPDVVRALIAALTEARAEVERLRTWRDAGWDAEKAARTERDAAEARLAAVRALHPPGVVCETCYDIAPMTWPCPTVRALGGTP
jgi:hypothetical protein